MLQVFVALQDKSSWAPVCLHKPSTACVLQDKELLRLRLQTVTSPRAMTALRANIRAEEEARAVAHQVAVRAVAAACAQEEARLAALPVHPVTAPVPDQVHYLGQRLHTTTPILLCFLHALFKQSLLGHSS